MPDLRVDDAIDHLVGIFANVPEATGSLVPHDQRPYGSDVWIPHVVSGYWQRRGVNVHELSYGAEPYYRPFYDGAWELCRIGVLRPGEVVTFGQGMQRGFRGDGYSLTAFGREWVRAGVARPPSDPSRFAEVLRPFVTRFGPGFEQRAVEAARCYRTNNYLAACVLAGAAAESILLAVAIAKVGDEGKVLAEYRSANGRKKVTSHILRGVASGLADQFTIASGILSYWRDEASHGTHTSISEVQAYASLAQLLRFAQLAEDNWVALTA